MFTGNGGWIYIYQMSQRKCWHHDDLPEGWEVVDFTRGNFVECRLARKLQADLTAADMELVISYEKEPEGWIGERPPVSVKKPAENVSQLPTHTKEMKLFKLTINEKLTNHSVADKYDYNHWIDPRGFVVIAEDEQAARHMASMSDRTLHVHETVQSLVWLDPGLTFCTEVEIGNTRQIVMGNIPTG